MKKLCAHHIFKTISQKPILQDVSVEVGLSEAVGILGPNGAGKTTLFYTLIGLLKPDSGSITLDGQDITHAPIYQRARMGIGYLPQDPSIFRGLSVEKNILAILELGNQDRQKQLRDLENLLDEFDLKKVRYSPSLTLSGGERRRLEIARTLAAKPSFILLDEPLAAIDPIAVEGIRRLIITLKKKGIGVIITDHNVRETLDIVDRAYIIHMGRVLKEGKPQEIVEDENVRKVYLGDKFSL